MPINKKEVTKRLNLSELNPKFKTAKNKAEIKEKVGKFVVEQINNYLDGSSSPVSGGKFKSFKKDKTPSRLFEEGDLRSSIVWRESPGGLKIGVFDDTEAPKGYNHNVGDTLPTRRFIPLSEETFKKPILDGIKRILKEEIES